MDYCITKIQRGNSKALLDPTNIRTMSNSQAQQGSCLGDSRRVPGNLGKWNLCIYVAFHFNPCYTKFANVLDPLWTMLWIFCKSRRPLSCIMMLVTIIMKMMMRMISLLMMIFMIMMMMMMMMMKKDDEEDEKKNIYIYLNRLAPVSRRPGRFVALDQGLWIAEKRNCR